MAKVGVRHLGRDRINEKMAFGAAFESERAEIWRGEMKGLEKGWRERDRREKNRREMIGRERNGRQMSGRQMHGRERNERQMHGREGNGREGNGRESWGVATRRGRECDTWEHMGTSTMGNECDTGAKLVRHLCDTCATLVRNLCDKCATLVRNLCKTCHLCETCAKRVRSVFALCLHELEGRVSFKVGPCGTDHEYDGTLLHNVPAFVFLCVCVFLSHL